MSRFTQPRRWSVLHKRMRLGQISEFDITPDEARTATMNICLECGYTFEEVLEYDPRRDEIKVEGFDPNTGHREEITIPGEVIGKIVMTMRALAGTGAKRLMRPSEIRAMVSKADKLGASDATVADILRG